MLQDILNSHQSDKERGHRYGILYELMFRRFRHRTEFKFMEIGTTGINGGSMTAFREYFSGEVFGLDVREPSEKLKGIHQIRGDAYCLETVEAILGTYGRMDVILDDGPHSEESHRFFFSNYPALLNPGGILVCEDCAAFYGEEELRAMVLELGLYCIDLRMNENTTDHDIVLIKLVTE